MPTPVISSGRCLPPPHVVVADDDVDMRELIALLLRSRGFDVVVASDGEAALTAILSGGADGLVSDFQMPGLDNLMLCRVLRSLRAYTALPIVVFTGLGEADPRLLPLRNINDLRILHKPLGLREITSALLEMIPMPVSGFGIRARAHVGNGNAGGRASVPGARGVLGSALGR